MTKRLVICCDGTWNVPDRQDGGKVCPSNVAKLALAVPRIGNDGLEQVLFYGKGVGTGARDRLFGGAFGLGLSRGVLDAYRFIVEYYDWGDQLYFFGFSRGAYTVRSTAGLIRNCGILKREHSGRVKQAYELYRRRDDASHPRGTEAQLFRRIYSHEVDIPFIGVWDTVGALGIPVGIPWIPLTWTQYINKRWEFHDTNLSTRVKHAYQALAIDEKRRQFEPAIWTQRPDAIDQHLEQLWFAGVHTNVGGGYQDQGLSDITLGWMIDKAEACGLTFDQAHLNESLKPNIEGELRESRTWFYRLIPSKTRDIGEACREHEAVHQSAVERTQRPLKKRYRPKNLLAFLKQGGKVADG